MTCLPCLSEVDIAAHRSVNVQSAWVESSCLKTSNRPNPIHHPRRLGHYASCFSLVRDHDTIKDVRDMPTARLVALEWIALGDDTPRWKRKVVQSSHIPQPTKYAKLKASSVVLESYRTNRTRHRRRHRPSSLPIGIPSSHRWRY